MILVLLPLLACQAGLAAAVGTLAFRPLLRLPEHPAAGARTFLIDWLALFVFLQYPLAFLLLVRNSPNVPMLAVAGAGVLILGLAVWVWQRGAQELSRRGVRDPWRRGLFLAFLYPLGILAAMAAFPALVWVLVGGSSTPVTAIATLLLMVAGPASLFLLRRGIAWVAAGADAEGDGEAPRAAGGESANGGP